MLLPYLTLIKKNFLVILVFLKLKLIGMYSYLEEETEETFFVGQCYTNTLITKYSKYLRFLVQSLLLHIIPNKERLT